MFFWNSGKVGEQQEEIARRWGLLSLKINRDAGVRGGLCWVKFAFCPLGSIYELLVSKKASLRSLWAEPRVQPVVA